MEPLILKISDYAVNKKVESDHAYDTAAYSMMDALGCAMLSLRYPECTIFLGPIVPN